jgi:hypothetical protein
MELNSTANDDNLPDPFQAPNREDLFIQYLFMLGNTTEAAMKAGYSATYAYTAIRKRFKDVKFLDKIREYARTHELVDSIPKILKIENKCLTYLETQADPSEIPKFAAILKQKKQIAGLLQQDTTPTAPTINIKEVRNLMLNVSHNDHITGDNQETQVQDAEVIE